MTLYQTLAEASLVFCAFQDDRLPADTDEFPDRHRLLRRDSAADTVCVARPQTRDSGGVAVGDLRVVAARKYAALSAGIALSVVGSRARRAGWHHRARCIDRSRS